MSTYQKHLSRDGGEWVGRFNCDEVRSPSIFVVVGWVNRNLIWDGMEPLDVWTAQEMHWETNTKMNKERRECA